MLVVGAGPVGLTMAAELARYGVSVRIVDKAPQPTDKSKALAVWSRTLEMLDRAGCVGSFLASGLQTQTATITAEEKVIARISVSGVDSPYPFALMIPQAETERLLTEHLSSLGIRVERSVELTEFSNSETGVSFKMRRADGTVESGSASWVVGCDGAHSTVRHLLGMEFAGYTMPTDWILGDVHLANGPDATETNIMWHPEGMLVLFPIAKDRFRVLADVGAAKPGVKRSDPTLEELQEALDRRGASGMKAMNPVWLAAFTINERKVADYRSGRVFLAGDAAHVHSPAGGQGMNTGMQDACNLAWKLALICRKQCAELPLLDTYSAERSPVAEMVLKGSGQATAIGTLRGPVRQAIRNHLAAAIFGLAAVRDKVASALSEITIGYPDSALSVQGAGFHGEPQQGQRAPIRKGEPAVSAGTSPRFAVFADNTAATAKLFMRHSQFLEPRIRPPFRKGGLWLVRPDGYVAVATSSEDWQTVVKYLDKLRGGSVGKA